MSFIQVGFFSLKDCLEIKMQAVINADIYKTHFNETAV